MVKLTKDKILTFLGYLGWVIVVIGLPIGYSYFTDKSNNFKDKPILTKHQLDLLRETRRADGTENLIDNIDYYMDEHSIEINEKNFLIGLVDKKIISDSTIISYINDKKKNK